jgi:putative addiction module component (TIGR02574 family)
MAPLSELKALPLSERIQLVEDLWDSIAEDQHALPDHPSVVNMLRERKAEYLANPGSGVSWEKAKQNIRSGRA